MVTKKMVVAQLAEQLQRSAVRIQVSVNFYIPLLTVNCIEKTKRKKKRPGMAHLNKLKMEKYNFNCRSS